MIKLIDLLNEIQYEQQQIAEIETILGRSLTESEMNEFNLKKAAKNLAVGAALGAATMFGSPEANAQKIQKNPTTATSTSNKALENKIKNYLVNKTWDGNFTKYTKYTFSTGDTMWIKIGDDDEYFKGKWKLNGNKLTITNTDKNTSETFTVKIIDKDNIMIGNNEFHYNVDPVD